MDDNCDYEKPLHARECPGSNAEPESCRPGDAHHQNTMIVHSLTDEHIKHSQLKRHDHEVTNFQRLQSMSCLSDESSLESIITNITVRQNSDTVLPAAESSQQKDISPKCSNSLFSISLSDLPAFRRLGGIYSMPSSQHKGISDAVTASSCELLANESILSDQEQRSVLVANVGCQAPDEQLYSQLRAFKSTQVNFSSLESLHVRCDHLTSMSNTKVATSSKHEVVFPSSASLHQCCKPTDVAGHTKIPLFLKNSTSKRSTRQLNPATTPQQNMSSSSMKKCIQCSDQVLHLGSATEQKYGCFLVHQRLSKKKEHVGRISQGEHHHLSKAEVFVSQCLHADEHPSLRNSPKAKELHFRLWNGKHPVQKLQKANQSSSEQISGGKQMFNQHALKSGDSANECSFTLKTKAQQNLCPFVQRTGHRIMMQYPYPQRQSAKLRLPMSNYEAWNTGHRNFTTMPHSHQNVAGKDNKTIAKTDQNQQKRSVSSKENPGICMIPAKRSLRARSAVCIRGTQRTYNGMFTNDGYRSQVFPPSVKKSSSLCREVTLNKYPSNASSSTENKFYCSEEAIPHLSNLPFWKSIVHVLKTAYSTASSFARDSRMDSMSHGSQVDAPDFVHFLEEKESAAHVNCNEPALRRTVSYTKREFFLQPGNRKSLKGRSRLGVHVETSKGKKLKQKEENIKIESSEPTITFVGLYKKDFQRVKQSMQPLNSKNNLETNETFIQTSLKTCDNKQDEKKCYKQNESIHPLKSITCKNVFNGSLVHSQVRSTLCNMKLNNRSLSCGLYSRTSPEASFIAYRIRSPSEKQISPYSKCAKKRMSLKQQSSKQRAHSVISSDRTSETLRFAPEKNVARERSFGSKQKKCSS